LNIIHKIEFKENKKKIGQGAKLFRVQADFYAIIYGKIRKHAIIAFGQFLRKLWTFCINNKFLAAFTPQLPQVCITFPHLIYFSINISNVLGKKFNFDHFYMIMNL